MPPAPETGPDAAPERRPASVYPVLALGLAAFASSSILVRAAGDVPAASLLVWRAGLSVLLLLPLAARTVPAALWAMGRDERGRLLLAGGLLALHFGTWIESLSRTSVASASVLVTTTPLFLAGFALVRRERLGLPLGLATLAGFGGAALIALGDAGGDGAGGDSLVGNGLALTAAFVFALYMRVGARLRQGLSWIAFVWPVYAIVAALALGYALLTDAPVFTLSPRAYWFCLAMAVGPQIAGHGAFNYALRYVPAVLLGLLTLLEPVGASIAAFFLFDERPAGLALAGMALTLGAVVLALVAPRWSRGRIREPNTP